MTENHVYEIRNFFGETVCTSDMPQLGYSDDRLRQILADGCSYYIDGKRFTAWDKKRRGMER